MACMSRQIPKIGAGNRKISRPSEKSSARSDAPGPGESTKCVNDARSSTRMSWWLMTTGITRVTSAIR
jgi:hypothetical protein